MRNVRPESEPMSNVDAAWLRMDTPSNLAVITGVMIFYEPVDFERLKATLECRLVPHRRFRQRVHQANPPFGTIRWEYDPNFSLDRHLFRVSLPDPGSQSQLQDLAGQLMSTPLDRSKPLWEYLLVDNVASPEGTGSALICRIHHCIADGLALVKVLLSFTDQDPDAPWPEPLPEKDHSHGFFSRLIKPVIKTALRVEKAVQRSEFFVHEGFETIIHPTRLLALSRTSLRAGLAAAELFLIPPDQKTILKGHCDVMKRAVWSEPLSLNDVKLTGKKMGGTVNDILISSVTGALRRYLQSHDQPVNGLNIRAIVPVNLRPPDDPNLFGNRFGLVFLSLPIGVQDPVRRLVTLRRRMNALKNSLQAVVAFGILTTMGMTPIEIEKIILYIFGVKGTAVMTNVPGPTQLIYLAGTAIRKMMFWVPAPANLSMGVSIISYAGEVMLGVATDACMIPDPETILEGFHDEFETMKNWGLQSAPNHNGGEPSTETQVSQQPPVGNPELCQSLTKTGRLCRNRAVPGYNACHVHLEQAIKSPAPVSH